MKWSTDLKVPPLRGGQKMFAKWLQEAVGLEAFSLEHSNSLPHLAYAWEERERKSDWPHEYYHLWNKRHHGAFDNSARAQTLTMGGWLQRLALAGSGQGTGKRIWQYSNAPGGHGQPSQHPSIGDAWSFLLEGSREAIQIGTWDLANKQRKIGFDDFPGLPFSLMC